MLRRGRTTLAALAVVTGAMGLTGGALASTPAGASPTTTCTKVGLSLSIGATIYEVTNTSVKAPSSTIARKGDKIIYTVQVGIPTGDCHPFTTGTVTLTLPNGTVKTLATGVSLTPKVVGGTPKTFRAPTATAYIVTTANIRTTTGLPGVIAHAHIAGVETHDGSPTRAADSATLLIKVIHPETSLSVTAHPSTTGIVPFAVTYQITEKNVSTDPVSLHSLDTLKTVVVTPSSSTCVITQNTGTLPVGTTFTYHCKVTYNTASPPPYTLTVTATGKAKDTRTSGNTSSGDPHKETASATVTVNKAQPKISTTPTPDGTTESPVQAGTHLNDKVTLSTLGNPVTGSGAGTITVKLFSPSHTTCTGTAAFTQTIKATKGNGTYTTTNTTVAANTAGIWHWTASYSGDKNNKGATSLCTAEPVTVGKPTFKVVKADTPGSGKAVKPGATIPYTVTVTNIGTFKGPAKLHDPMPSNVVTARTATCPAGCTASFTGTTLNISIATLAVGAHVTVTFDATVLSTDTTTVVNTVTFTTTTPCVEANCSSTVTNPVLVFKVVKADTPGSGKAVKPGATIPYTVTVTNIGTAKGPAKLNDPLPSNLSTPKTAACSPTTGCTASFTGTTLNISIATLAVGAHVTITFKATVLSTDTTTVVNTVTFTETTPCIRATEPVAASVATIVTGCSSTVTNPVLVFKVVKSDVPGSGKSVKPGTTIPYTVTVTNIGSSKGPAKLTDTLPSNVVTARTAICSPTTGCTATIVGSKLTISIATLAVEASVTVTFKATVTKTDTTTVVNTVTFTPTTPCITTGCSSTVTNPVPVLSGTKAQTPPSGSTVARTSIVTYSLKLSNAGTAAATNVKETDAIPAGTTYVTGSASCGGAPGCKVSEKTGKVTWTGITVGPGSSVTLTFQVKVNATDPNGDVIPNHAVYTNVGTPGCTTATCTTNTVTVIVVVRATTVAGTPPVTTTTVPRSTAAISGATTVHTGEPWAGSRWIELLVGSLGMAMLLVGALLRRRLHRATIGR